MGQRLPRACLVYLSMGARPVRPRSASAEIRILGAN